MSRRAWLAWADGRPDSPIEQDGGGLIRLAIDSEMVGVRLEPPTTQRPRNLTRHPSSVPRRRRLPSRVRGGTPSGGRKHSLGRLKRRGTVPSANE